MTIREYISDITNSLRAISLDDWISPRFIYLKTQSVISDFLKKDVSSNRLLFKTDGFSEASCLEMEEVPVTECDLDIYLCQKLMKSKYPLPDIYESKFGAIINQVASIDFSNIYTNIYTPKQWKATQKREFIYGRYFFIIDNYLYIPIGKKDQDLSPAVVRVQAYFKDKKAVDDLNAKNECGSCKPEKENCTPFLDYDLVIPNYLQNDVKKEVINQIASIYLKVVPDSYPNLNPLEKTSQ